MLNTLGVRSALAAKGRKLSFRNVANVVTQLLHTIKYSVPVPFSNLATGQFPSGNAGQGGLFSDARKVFWNKYFFLFVGLNYFREKMSRNKFENNLEFYSFRTYPGLKFFFNQLG